jgi:hypothetical protein
MPLATKNNALIVKDGKLAENCNCCGGWYCCADTTCSLDQLTTATISITASDYYSRYIELSGGTDGALYQSVGVRLAAYSGIHTLARVSAIGSQNVRFQKDIKPFGVNKCDGFIFVEASRQYLNWTIAFTAVHYLAAYGLPESQRYRSLSDLDCFDFTQYPSGLLIKQETIPWAFNGVDAYKTCDAITGDAFTPATRRWPLYDFQQNNRPAEFTETGSRVVTVNGITLNQ